MGEKKKDEDFSTRKDKSNGFGKVITRGIGENAE